ncbi:4,5-DOPA dioxygenase extradiol [Campylobacter sp. MIT 99-7217]|uniref:4,5-DOPA-extradiol-dioxygenase n=1 Tax=Campylobacter sp. MIT 99-7217 TaxID=535091 RepID=UPI00115B8D3D|nr:class III extradiol ring-cleavage dioxygenase [Campylobacter sp. MIT 99-7217]TQR34738.1 4,5-DOPA dioxygenase extradiol [Campylobacter sp. MIT 99-7217]
MKMPVVFIGHGSPMNALLENENTQNWRNLGQKIKPKAILAISAHWYGKDIRLSHSDEKLEQIYDMYGFPKELYELKYSPRSNAKLASHVQSLLKDFNVKMDNSWGIDHGLWSVLCKMYPSADIEVVVMSVALDLPMKRQFELGKALRALRDEEILIFASGNIVHNLSLMHPNYENKAFEWTLNFDEFIKKAVLEKDYESILNFEQSPFFDQRCFASLEHFLPFINALGASTKEDPISVFNQNYNYGSVSMTSYLWGEL